MTHPDSIQCAAQVVVEKKSVLEETFGTGYGVAGRLRTGMGTLLPRDLAGGNDTRAGRIARCGPVLSTVARDPQTPADQVTLAEECAARVDGYMLFADAEKDRLDFLKAEVKAAQKMASRPLGTLVSLMQAGDAFDQRLCHVVSSLEEFDALPHAVAASAAVVVHAQLDAVGAKITDTRTQMRNALDTISDLLTRTGAKISACLDKIPQGGMDADPELAEKLTMLASRLQDAEHSGVLAEAAAAAATSTPEGQGFAKAGEEAARRAVDLIGAIDDWIEADAALSMINHALAEAQAGVFEVYAPPWGAMCDEASLDFMMAMYTMDEERSIHSHAIAQARAMPQARQRKAG